MRARQLSFLPKTPNGLEHGGQIRQGRRKLARPIALKQPLHLVLRASIARGPRSMLAPAHERRIRRIIDTAAEKYGIRVYRFVNVGNHLHLLVQTRTRPAFQGFLREISGRIAMLVTGSRKSHPIDPQEATRPAPTRPTGSRSRRKRFWDLLAYTRVVSWGRDFANLKDYFIKNLFEAVGALTPAMKRAGVRMFSSRAIADGRMPPPPRPGPARPRR